MDGSPTTRATDHNSSRSNKTSSTTIASDNTTEMYQSFDFYSIYSPNQKEREFARQRLEETMLRSADQISKFMPNQEDRDEMRILAKSGVESFFSAISKIVDPDSDEDSIDDRVASRSGLSKADSKRATDSFISISTRALKNGDRISLVGFGSWSVSQRAARTGRNPQTGKEIKISAKNVVRFKAGSELSKKVN